MWVDIGTHLACRDAGASQFAKLAFWFQSLVYSQPFESRGFIRLNHCFSRVAHSPWILLIDPCCTFRNNPIGFYWKQIKCESHEDF